MVNGNVFEHSPTCFLSNTVLRPGASQHCFNLLNRSSRGSGVGCPPRRTRLVGASPIRSCAEARSPGSVSSGNGVAGVTPSESLEARNGLVADDMEDPMSSFLKDARIVDVKLPLDAFLEESADGRVFVDEVVPGGNAEKTAAISEGDIILAVSLPFGDGIVPVPAREGIDMIRDYIRCRDSDEQDFKLALVSSNVDILRRNSEDDKLKFISAEEMRGITEKVFISEYPSMKLSREDKKPIFDPDSLIAEGFDMS